MTFKDSIVLYKTPLDADYANVYDDYSSTFDYVTFLNNFTHITVILTTDRTYSRKNVDDLFEFVLDGYDSMDLHDYNYMKFTTAKDEIKFAFILSVDSENDNQTNPSVLLHCKLDAWSNHYNTLKDRYSLVSCKRATVDNNLYPNMPSSIKRANLSVKRKIIKFLQSNNDEYCVLWQRLVLSQSPEGYNAEGYLGTGSSVVVFRPAGMLCLRDDNHLVFANATSIYVYGRTSILQDYDLLSATPCLGIPNNVVVQSSLVLSNTYTYTVPFTYSITIQANNTFKVDIDNTVILKSLGDDTNGLRWYEQESGTIHTATIVKPEYISTYGKWIIPTTYTDMTIPKIECKQGEISYDSSKRDVALFDTACEESIIYNEYPFKYHSIFIGSNEVKFVGYPSNQYKEIVDNESVRYAGLKTIISYDYRAKLGACIRIHNEGENDFIWLPVESNGEMDRKGVPYDEYMMRNQSSFILSVGNGVLKAVAGLATTIGSLYTGNPVGVVAGAGTVISSASVLGDLAKIDDLKSAPDTVTTSGIYPQTVPYQIDLVCLVENTAIMGDTPYAKRIIYNYHAYGDDVDYSQSVIAKNRDYFDYIQGYATINAEISEEDKIRLVNAISKGITKWHISNHTSTIAGLQALKYMNKNVTNYPISLIPQGE